MNQFFSPPRLLEESKPYFVGANSGMLTQRGAATLSGMLASTGVEQTGFGYFALGDGALYRQVKSALSRLGYHTASYQAVLTSFGQWCTQHGVIPSEQAAYQLILQAATMMTRPPLSTGLKGLGDWASDLVSSISTASSDALSTITGAKAQQTAQQNAILLAQQQAQAQVAQSQLRTAGWVSAAPWVAIGVVGVVGTLVYALMKKR